MRGRGTLEIRRCDNPFFQSVGADIGMNSSNANLEWKVNGSPTVTSAKPYKVDGNFAFLYTRESDKIGGKVLKPETSEVRMLSRSEFLKQRRDKALEASAENSNLLESPISKPTAEDMLKSYRHQPKEEDPRYITSAVRLPYSNNCSVVIYLS